ncbi:hypothetical protein PQR37_37285 [Paraburkholderia nemoris]|uniref:hypothetical protein n=1 Tax=Paraburkholderia nemoris TaxID=2793076 RepID=UPI0038BAD305
MSRPLVYRQLRQASAALDDVFSPARTDDTGEVFFMLPVTQRWLDQVILALTMVGHVAFRATIELMRDLFGVPTSLGTNHTVLQQAAQQAIAINAGIDRSPIDTGLHDELFQGPQPVLAGVDVLSTSSSPNCCNVKRRTRHALAYCGVRCRTSATIFSRSPAW